MEYGLTMHAREALVERGIAVEWMEAALSDPMLVLPDPDDPAVERRFRRIAEFEGRVLRAPWIRRLNHFEP